MHIEKQHSYEGRKKIGGSKGGFREKKDRSFTSIQESCFGCA